MKEMDEWISKEESFLANAVREYRGSERAEAKIRKKLLGDTKKTGDPRLVTETKNGRYSYYLEFPGKKRVYLKKQDCYPLIRCLAQKEYNERVLRTINKRQTTLMKMKKLVDEEKVQDVYDSMSPARKEIVKPILISDEEYARQWQEKEYMKNDYALPDNYEEIYTKKGEIVRSKSEKILADMFYDNDIPYRYEPEFVLNSGKRVFPDFLLLNKRTRCEYLWEHFGMMDDMEYVRHNVAKLREYENSGYLLGEKLLFSYESSSLGLSTVLVKNYIEIYLK